MKYNDYLEPIDDSQELLRKFKVFRTTTVLCLLLLAGCTITLFTQLTKESDVIEKVKEIQIYHQASDTLNIKNVYDYAVQLNLKHPHIFTAQVVVEAGWDVNSDLSRDNCNICGMRQATQRPTTNIRNSTPYGKYNNWKECVIDYAFLQCKYFRGSSEDDYYKWLADSGYARDEDYISKVQKIADKIKTEYGSF